MIKMMSYFSQSETDLAHCEPPHRIQKGRISGTDPGTDPATDPGTDPATDPAIDSDTKNWNIGKILSHAPDRHWGSFTRVPMIVYGYLNTFLPILKIFDSCRPPTTPFSAARFVGSLWKMSKKCSKSSKSPKSPKSWKIGFEFGHLWTRNALVWVFWLFLNLYMVFNPLLKLFAVHMCLWEAIWALWDGFRWCKLPDMAKLLKSPKLRETAQTGLKWPQLTAADLKWPQITSKWLPNANKRSHSVI